MTPLSSSPSDSPEPAAPESIRRVEVAYREGFRLRVEDFPAWLPSLDYEKKALASLSKAWPVLCKHADHIDGEFDNALTDVRRMFAAFRAEVDAYGALARRAQEAEARVEQPLPEGATRGVFPGILDYEREVIVGGVLRRACDVEMIGHEARFHLTASVGEVAQRIVVALAAREVSP